MALLGRGQTVQPLPSQQSVVVHGHKIVYYETGKGSAVILIHGSEANKRWATTDLGPNAFARHVRNGDSYTIASSVAEEMMTGQEFEDKKLGKVHLPTLIIWGRDDMLIPLAMGEQFQKKIKGSQLLVIEGTGHIPMVGKPAELNQPATKFLAGKSS
jgi:fermentation-respiration switch protein FrsA (DUF1100 family)